MLRDLGINYGQGYFLGRPARLPREKIEEQAHAVIRNRTVSVFPELRRASSLGALSRLSIIKAPTANLATSNDELALIFFDHPKLHAIAVVDGSRPVAIINRTFFMNEYSKLYYREIWGRKSCMLHANTKPRLIERQHNIDELVGILTSEDQRYLADGFIVTENSLVAKLTQAHCDPRRDFVGHVGGDDFILLYQSEDWQAQCQQIIDEFDAQAVALFDASAREAGGIQAEDRFGVSRFFPLTTLSIGAVKVNHGEFTRAEQVASVAASAKHAAKLSGKGLAIKTSGDGAY